jgi:hypothetical protein
MSGRLLAAVCLLGAALLVPASGCAAKTAKKKKAKPAAGGAAAQAVEPEPEKLPEINRASAITVDQGRLMVASPLGGTSSAAPSRHTAARRRPDMITPRWLP